MSLLERIADWRDPRHYDQPPTDEEAARQFLFTAISDFIEENEVLLVEWLTTSDDDEVPHLDAWVDEYAQRPLPAA